MGKCFVTKLKGVSSNVLIPKLGEFVLQVPPSKGDFSIEFHGDDCEIYTLGNEDVLSKDKSSFANRQSEGIVYLKTDKSVYVAFTNKYNLTSLNINGGNLKIDFDYNNIKYCNKLQILGIQNATNIQEISPISNLSNTLRIINIENTDAIGNISVFSNFNVLSTLKCNSLQLSGELSTLKSIPNIEVADFMNNQKISGDLSDIANLTKLTNLTLRGTLINGDISSLQNLTKLETISFGVHVTGNFKTLCENLNRNGKTSGTLKIWAYGSDIMADETHALPDNEVIASFEGGSISYSGIEL